jgi:Holliday junction resolvasome RuvABC ATP-dependent DNA helicase subunit
MTHYSDEEMMLLIRQRAKRLGWTITDDSINTLAKRSRGVPRLSAREIAEGAG